MGLYQKTGVIMNRTYDLFKGKELEIAEKIQQRRLQILVHSCIYYELDRNIVSDATWDKWAKELVKLQAQHPYIAKEVIWADAFKGFDGSTGFDLPIRDEWVMRKAKQLCGVSTKKKAENKKPKTTNKLKGGKLF